MASNQREDNMLAPLAPSSPAMRGSDGSMRRRVTSHQQSLQRIHNDTLHRNGKSKVRHVVPEPDEKPRWESHSTDGTESQLAASEAANDIMAEEPPERWVDRHKQGIRDAFQQRSVSDWFAIFVPLYGFFLKHGWRKTVLGDVMAGLAVGVMVVPQSMSYAKLAGLPVEFGLYSSLVPIYAYALFGSSRQLAVGPVALVSLLLNTGLTAALERKGMSPESTPDYDAIYATMALQTGFVVGVCFMVMGVLRLGFVTIFLSHAVVSGFTSGAAIIIGFSQVKYIFGYSIPSTKTLQDTLKHLFASINEFNYKTFLLGTSCVLILVGLKYLAQKYPSQFKWTRAIGPLLVTVLSITMQATMDLEARGVPVVGEIPKGFPNFSGNLVFPLTDMASLFVPTLSIVLIGFMESIAIAKQLAYKHNYELDSSLELVGMGMANMASGLFGGYPVAGSFSRSAVNNDAGAQSAISSIVTATLVGLVLLFLTAVFELLPLCALAAIVISGVISLVDYPEAIYLWKVHKFDFTVWVLAFAGTLFLGAELGLGIAVLISLLVVIFESAYPSTTVLGRLPGTHHYRNVKQYPRAERYDGIVIVGIDAPIYFANSQNVREKISKYYFRAQEEMNSRVQENPTFTEDNRVKYIVLDLSPVSHVDTSALHMLADMHSNYKKTLQIQLCLANPNRIVMQQLVLSGLADDIGREHMFVSLHDAVEHCLGEMDEQDSAPLRDSKEHQTGDLFTDESPVTKAESLPFLGKAAGDIEEATDGIIIDLHSDSSTPKEVTSGSRP